jgi:hypothetical protein
MRQLLHKQWQQFFTVFRDETPSAQYDKFACHGLVRFGLLRQAKLLRIAGVKPASWMNDPLRWRYASTPGNGTSADI